MDFSDRKGRTPAERVFDIERYGDPITDAERAAATYLLEDMLRAAAQHGVTLADLDGVVDLPGGCLDVVVARRLGRR